MKTGSSWRTVQPKLTDTYQKGEYAGPIRWDSKHALQKVNVILTAAQYTLAPRREKGEHDAHYAWTRHNTINCWNERRRCYYCGSKKHHKALCTSPRGNRRYYKEVEEIHRELEMFEDFYGPSSQWLAR
ncbi:hypothetical protein COOONC_01248 [Cooperia oncophora]